MFVGKQNKKKQAQEAKTKGNEFFGKGQFKQALEHYTKAIKLDPTDPAFYSNRALTYSNLDLNDKAIQDANQCIKLKPDWSKGYYRKGVALFNLKQYEEAKKEYETGLSYEPDNQEIQKSLQQVIGKLNAKRVDANGQPLSESQIAKQEGNLAFKEGRFEEALAQYSKALELTTMPSEKSVLHSNRAACFAQHQNWSEGLKECNKALEYDPKNVKALLRRGLAYEGLERWQLATDDMKQVLTIEPGAKLASEALVRLDRNLRAEQKFK